MFQVLDNLFRSKNKKMTSDNSAKDEAIEKKKCKKCLRRVGYEYSRCPFCDCPEFHDF